MSDRIDNLAADTADRGLPQLPAKRKSRMSGLLMALVGVLMIAGIVGFIALSIQRFTEKHQADQAETARIQKEKAAQSAGPAGDLSAEQARIKRDEDEQKRIDDGFRSRAASSAAAASAASAATALATPAGANSAAGYGSNPNGARPVQFQMGQQPLPAQTVQSRRLDGGVLTFDGDKDSVGGSNGGPAALGSNLAGIAKQAAGELVPGSGKVAGARSTNPLDQQLQGSEASRSPVRKASFLPNLTYLLERGTIIRCVMGTKVVTDYPGMTACTVSQDVYSADGRTLLIRKGAEVKGEQRNALTQGQARVMVLWTRIDDGPVKLDIDSPTADPLGGSGMEAYVDNHFLQRFGGAMLVSLIGDFGSAIANKSVGNSGITFSTSANTTESMAAEVLKASINIPPTAYTLQGAETNIYVAQDIDFSDVYETVHVSRRPQ
jgi:type IV secretion system protein VirB10